MRKVSKSSQFKMRNSQLKTRNSHGQKVVIKNNSKRPIDARLSRNYRENLVRIYPFFSHILTLSHTFRCAESENEKIGENCRETPTVIPAGFTPRYQVPA